MDNVWTCPRGCDAVMEYVGIDDGFGETGNMCCDLYECPACGEQVSKDCFMCLDDSDECPDETHYQRNYKDYE